MHKFLTPITDWVSTKRGMWITIITWFVVMIALSMGPRLNDYKVANFQSLPDDAQSIFADQKLKEYFPNDQGTPGILVFHNSEGEVANETVEETLTAINAENIDGIDSIIDISQLPPQALDGFYSDDNSTMIVPMTLEAGLGGADFSAINDRASEIGSDTAAESGNLEFYVTGPAGIAGDTVKLFEETDFVLLIATVLIFLVLLIVIYRSPLPAFIRPDTKLLGTDIHSVLIGFVVAIGLVSIIGMIWLARQLTRPIVQLTEATKHIARENYNYPLDIKRKDEIGQLSESFNLMQTQLQQNDLARKEFISNVSHDFQSPLMNIQGYADLLKSPDLPDADRLACTSIIDQEASGSPA